MGGASVSYSHFHNFMLLFCVKSFGVKLFVYQTCDAINLCVLSIMEMFTREYIYHKTKSLGACDKLFHRCSPYKDQVLNTWMILVEQYVSFNSCIF